MTTLAKLPRMSPRARQRPSQSGVERASGAPSDSASRTSLPAPAVTLHEGLRRIFAPLKGRVKVWWKDVVVSSRPMPPDAPVTAAPSQKSRWAGLALLLLALCVGVAFLTFMFAATDGHFVPQVVDLYLVCQYAKAMAEGHPFQYNLGDAPSTGATSLLYTAYLGLAHAVGLRGEGLVAFAIASGLACFLVSVILARRIAALLAGPDAGLLAGALVALGGPVVWGFLYGSDIAPFMVLALWLLEQFLVSWTEGTPSFVMPAVLLALARPEGLPLGAFLGLAWLLGPGRSRGDARRLIALAPTAAGASVLVLYRVVTGSWLGSSVADKSLFANYGWGEGLALAAEYTIDVVRGLLLGFYPSQSPVGFGRGWASLYFPPLGLLLILAAAVLTPEKWRRPLTVWLTGVALLFALLAPNMYLGFHFNRYVLWAFPGLLALAAAGLVLTARQLAGGDQPLSRRLLATASLVILALGLLSTARFAVIYGELAGEVYRRDVATAQWITKNLPAGVAMANLATSVEYLTGHRNLNLHGVTSPAFFGNRPAEREANVFEALGRLPASERPPYLIASVDSLDSLPVLRELTQGPPLFRSIGFGDEIVILRTRYDLLGRNASLHLASGDGALRGLAEVDRLNVCDTRDEVTHDYRYRSHLGNLTLHGTARLESYPQDATPPLQVADGGRAILGFESFTIRTVPDKELIIVLRTAPTVNANVFRASGSARLGIEFPEAGIALTVNGQPSGRLVFKPRAGWDEVTIRVTRTLITGGVTTLQLSGRYASFQYWFFQ